MFGTTITDWSAVEGAYYAGHGSEGIWLAVSMLLCVLALVIGARHSSTAFKKVR